MDQAQTPPGEMDLDPSELEPPADMNPWPGLRRLAARGVSQLGVPDRLAGIDLLRRRRGRGVPDSRVRPLGILIATPDHARLAEAVGIADKYVQQNEPDQEPAFQKAFTLELGISHRCSSSLVVALAPVLRARLRPPGDHRPRAICSRCRADQRASRPRSGSPTGRCEFVRQRMLVSVDPVVAFAVDGRPRDRGARLLGLVIGALAGTSAAAIVAVRHLPVSAPAALRARDAARVRELLLAAARLGV